MVGSSAAFPREVAASHGQRLSLIYLMSSVPGARLGTRWALRAGGRAEEAKAAGPLRAGGRREVLPHCAQRSSRLRLLFPRPFLEMVYHALDSPDDDYHALFVLCLLYAMSHNKGESAPCPSSGAPLHSAWRGEGRRAALLEELPAGLATSLELLLSRVRISQVLFFR